MNGSLRGERGRGRGEREGGKEERGKEGGRLMEITIGQV